MKAVITVLGCDQVGIIAKVSGILAQTGVNILDISQTIMQDMFTMIMLVDMSQSNCDIKCVTDKLSTLEKDMGLSIHIQNKELFNSMHRI